MNPKNHPKISSYLKKIKLRNRQMKRIIQALKLKKQRLKVRCLNWDIWFIFRFKNGVLLSWYSCCVLVDVLLKAAGDAPILKKKKWAVDANKTVAYLVQFIRKLIKCAPSDSLVSINFNN